MSPVRVKVKPSCPDRNLFQTVESGVRVLNSIVFLYRVLDQLQTEDYRPGAVGAPARRPAERTTKMRRQGEGVGQDACARRLPPTLGEPRPVDIDRSTDRRRESLLL